ncbi:unnamed protein product [Lupinus luteus]|uniref:Uncharacterized protein n=1 Tax=Lupinus luteus TaxID=3873 RepID=A0AAV1VQN4_LUPLU
MMLGLPICSNYASTITFSSSTNLNSLTFAPYNFNISKPRALPFNVLCKSQQKAHRGGDFGDVVPNIIDQPLSSNPAVNNKGYDEIGSGGEVLKLEEGIGVKVSIELSNGEYNLKIKKISSDDKKDVLEMAEETAHSAGMLFLQAEMLTEMAHQILAHYRSSFRSTLTN